MSELAALLRENQGAIAGAFRARRPGSALVVHVAALVDVLADAVERDAPPVATTLEGAWLDLPSLLDDVGALRDSVYSVTEAAGVSALSIREARAVGDVMAAVMRNAVTDIASTREAFLERQRSELLGLFEQSPGWLAYNRGKDLVYELENEAYKQIIGNRDVHGRPIREAIPELAGQGFFEMLEGVLETGVPVIRRNIPAQLQLTPNAPLETVVLDLIFQPIRDASGTVVGVLQQGNDRTAMQRQELARREAEQRYQTLFQSIDDGYCLMQMIDDASGRTIDYHFLETNAAFEKQTGLIGALGKTALELVPNLDRSWFERYGAVAKTGVSSRFESHAPAMGRWFDVYASRVGDPASKLVALVFKDVTARKEAEVEREALLSRESAARKDAENANRLRDDFLATVSHELRTPLNAMLGWVQMLRMGTLPVEKQRHALETIERNARAQTQLIDDLLDVTRILAGKLRLELEPVDLTPLVRAACDAIEPSALAKEIRVECTTEPGLTTLGDVHRLEQIVGNLLSNAVKFSSRGGLVRLVAEAEGSTAKIEVSDTGQGIAPEFLPHVFERFRQAHGGTTRPHGGLGLGLAIVRQLVEMHDGTVTVTSPGPRKGATFVVRLPLGVPAKAPGTERRAAPSHSDLSSSRVLEGLDVLIVEDEPDTRDMIRTMAELLGGRVRVAVSAREAFESLENEAPDLILSDIGMPEEDGYSFIERVRALPAERGGAVPAVALTAFNRTEERTRALRAGFDFHVAKPVEAAELTAVLNVLVHRVRK